MNTWIGKGLVLLVAISVGAGVGLVWPQNAATSPADGPPRAWIDDPLDGATVDLGPVEVVAHAYDPAGLTGMRLMVDGAVVAENPLDAAGVLAHLTWTWTPPADGVYVLEVTGSGKSGTGLPGRALVIVGRTRGTAPTSSTTSTTTTIPVSTTTSIGSSSTVTTLPATTTTVTTATTVPTSITTTTTVPTTTTSPGPCTPPAPILLSPLDGAAYIGPDLSLTLDWSAWRGATPTCQPSGFYAELARAPGARPIASQHFGPETTEWIPSRTVWSCNADHYWRVYSKRSDGSLGAVSEVWRIRVNCVG